MILESVIKDNQDLALKAADQLPEERKRIFLLMMDGKHEGEISRLLKLSRDVVRVQLNRAQHAIAKSINSLN